jgi:hypothetical protein
VLAGCGARDTHPGACRLAPGTRCVVSLAYPVDKFPPPGTKAIVEADDGYPLPDDYERYYREYSEMPGCPYWLKDRKDAGRLVDVTFVDYVDPGGGNRRPVPRWILITSP